MSLLATGAICAGLSILKDSLLCCPIDKTVATTIRIALINVRIYFYAMSLKLRWRAVAMRPAWRWRRVENAENFYVLKAFHEALKAFHEAPLGARR